MKESVIANVSIDPVSSSSTDEMRNKDVFLIVSIPEKVEGSWVTVVTD